MQVFRVLILSFFALSLALAPLCAQNNKATGGNKATQGNKTTQTGKTTQAAKPAPVPTLKPEQLLVSVDCTKEMLYINKVAFTRKSKLADYEQLLGKASRLVKTEYGYDCFFDNYGILLSAQEGTIYEVLFLFAPKGFSSDENKAPKNPFKGTMDVNDVEIPRSGIVEVEHKLRRELGWGELRSTCYRASKDKFELFIGHGNREENKTEVVIVSLF